MSICAISYRVRFLDSCARCTAGFGDEESKEEVTEMASLGPGSLFLLQLDEAQTWKGRRGREVSLTRDVETRWIVWMMSAERRQRKGVDSIVRRMHRRRRDVGKGTSALGLGDEPKPALRSRGLCSVSG